jgi:hypothetical protein
MWRVTDMPRFKEALSIPFSLQLLLFSAPLHSKLNPPSPTHSSDVPPAPLTLLSRLLCDLPGHQRPVTLLVTPFSLGSFPGCNVLLVFLLSHGESFLASHPAFPSIWVFVGMSSGMGSGPLLMSPRAALWREMSPKY